MYWEVWLPGAVTPVMIRNQFMLHQFLNDQPQGTVMNVKAYQLVPVMLGTTAYNVPGGPPLPPKPKTPPKFTIQQWTHYHVG